MNSTTSMSSPRTSSTPATSDHVVPDLEPLTMLAGLVRGIIPTVLKSSQTITMISKKNASGSQVVAKSAAAWNQSPTIPVSYRQDAAAP